MLLLLWIIGVLAVGEAGLLRIPKVYNAVITSNQNLSPSRAFPVIQPVIHRTAIGYVPPLYYAQVLPNNAASSESLTQPQKALKSAAGDQEPKAKASASASASARAGAGAGAGATAKVEAKPKDDAALNSGRMREEIDQGTDKTERREKSEDQLSFYPNYHSFYYEPYIYTYNGYSGEFGAGNYYVNFDPYSVLPPIASTAPTFPQIGHLLSAFPYREERQQSEAKAARNQVADAPAGISSTTGERSP